MERFGDLLDRTRRRSHCGERSLVVRISKPDLHFYQKPFSVLSHSDCYVDDERVEAQPGDFYGGWITRELVGPFKGMPGSWGW